MLVREQTRNPSRSHHWHCDKLRAYKETAYLSPFLSHAWRDVLCVFFVWISLFMDRFMVGSFWLARYQAKRVYNSQIMHQGKPYFFPQLFHYCSELFPWKFKTKSKSLFVASYTKAPPTDLFQVTKNTKLIEVLETK